MPSHHHPPRRSATPHPRKAKLQKMKEARREAKKKRPSSSRRRASADAPFLPPSPFGPWVPRIPNENPHHLPGHNFTGPGTNVLGRIALGVKPTNAVDAASMQHDLAYNTLKTNFDKGYMDRDAVIRGAREADLKLIHDVHLIPPELVPKDGSKQLVLAAMFGKIAAENANVLNPTRFVGIALQSVV